MPALYANAPPRARHCYRTKPLPTAEHDAPAPWQRLLDTRPIGPVTELSDATRAAIAGHQRVLCTGAHGKTW